MEVFDLFLDSLKEKLVLVLKKNEAQEQKISLLNSEITELKKIVTNLENKIKETENKNLALIMNQSLGKVNDSSELKKKINEMVREIDKCIAYLNK